MNVELIVVRHAAVIFQRLGSARLLVQRCHRNIADFKKLGSGEEDKVRRVVVNRIHHAAFIEKHGGQPALLNFDAARQPRRARPYDCYIKLLHSSPSPLVTLNYRSAPTFSYTPWSAAGREFGSF